MYEKVVGYIYISKERNKNEIYLITKSITKPTHENCLKHLCCCCSIAKSCLTLCDPMGCNMTGFPVPLHLLEFAQVHVYCISDSTQTSHLLVPSFPAFKLSQHQSLFHCVGYSHQMGKILELQLQAQSFQWICRLISFKFDWLTSLLSKELLKVFSSTTVGKHQFFSALPSLWPSSHNRIERPYIALTIQTFVCKVVSLFFNTLSRFVIAFLPRSNHLLISRLQHLYLFKIYRSCTNNNCS